MMPEEKDDNPGQIDRVCGDWSLVRLSEFIGRCTRELARTARDLQLSDDVEVVFPDKNLEAAIRENLEKSEGPIIRGDLRKLSGLGAASKKIGNLSGLEHAANLTFINLNSNQISDVSPLVSLTNLTDLWISDNQISDINPLSSLTNLTNLLLRANQISDVSPLAFLTNLTELDLADNPLNQESIDVHVPNFEVRGMMVTL